MLESLFNKVATLFQPHPKRDFNKGDSCENSQIFMNSSLYGTLGWLFLSFDKVTAP